MTTLFPDESATKEATKARSDDPWKDDLVREPMFADVSQNPHELMLVTCGNCRERDGGTRTELHEAGWVLFREPKFHAQGDGFPVCQGCCRCSYSWEDLY